MHVSGPVSLKRQQRWSLDSSSHRNRDTIYKDQLGLNFGNMATGATPVPHRGIQSDGCLEEGPKLMSSGRETGARGGEEIRS